MIIKHSMTFVCSLVLFFSMSLPSLAQQRGIASYYGNGAHGRLTSSGVRYNKDSLMCAHKTLPFGTKIKVKNLKNNKEVVVTVTDRGPFGKGRIVDLSMAAAKQLDMVSAGLAQVILTPLQEQEVPDVIKMKYEGIKLPELQFFDTKTGNYYSLAEWSKRDAAAKEAAHKQEMQKRRAMYLAKVKRQQPRWRILNDRMTAKSTK